jgi:hypothetical protein
MIDALINAFEMANTEVLHIAMPEAVIKDVSTALLRRWNCSKSEIVGKPLMKFGTGLISARHLPLVPGSNALPEIEISYTPPLGSYVKSVFRSQTMKSGCNLLCVQVVMRFGTIIMKPAKLLILQKCWKSSVKPKAH